jgi:hypothetical protein
MKKFKHSFWSLLILISFLYACSKESSEPVYPPTSTTIQVKLNNVDTTIYFKATNNGTAIQLYPDTIYTNVIGDSSRKVPSGNEYNPFSFVVKINSKTTPVSYTYPNSGGISFIFDTTGISNSTAYRNLIQVKAYSYGKISTKTTTKGVSGARVFYTDINGVVWASDKGLADQTGSSFVVNSYIDYTDPRAPGTYKKIKVSFSCKVYDGLGNFKIFTNGSFSGKLINL